MPNSQAALPLPADRGIPADPALPLSATCLLRRM